MLKLKTITAGKPIRKIFEAGILLKAIFGFFEILGGILFSFSKKIITDNFIIFLAQEEIAEDPNDIFANYLINVSNSLSQDSHIFAVAYLLFHGAVNIFLAASLARGRVKTYPTVILLLGIFIAYQAYKYFNTMSLSILFLTMFDIFFAGIIYLEYKKRHA